MDEMWDIVVVGGGLAGMAAAATAAGGGDGWSVAVLDGQGGGGRAATDVVGRFRFNRGAHALYKVTAGREVLRRLGVTVVGSEPPLKGSLARLGDEVGLLPVGMASGMRTSLLPARGKVAAAKFLAGLKRWRADDVADRTASQWLDDLGLDGTARLLVEALIRLTAYVADTESVSADLVLGQLQMASAGVDYVNGGWVTVADGLATAAQDRGAVIDTGATAKVRAVVPDEGRVRVVTDERTLLARRVILATGTPEATTAILPEAPPTWGSLGPPARVACLDLGLASIPKVHFLLGIDRPLYLSRHSPPTGLSPEGGAMYGSLRYLRSDEDPTPDDARREMTEHCLAAGIDPGTAEESRYLHRMVVCGALPTPEAGGMRGRPAVTTGLPGVLLAGDWVGPEGHLADAALVSGETAGRTAVEELAREGAVPATA
jgi:glycine/D-amino acid oxidase-like deaminating enzyme